MILDQLVIYMNIDKLHNIYMYEFTMGDRLQ